MGQWAHVPQGSVPRRRRRCQREPLPEARLYACAPCRRGRLHGDTEGVRRNRSPEARLYSCAPCRRGRFLGDTEGVRENRSHRHVCTHALRAGGAGFPATPKVSKGTAPAGTFRIMRSVPEGPVSRRHRRCQREPLPQARSESCAAGHVPNQPAGSFMQGQVLFSILIAHIGST